MVAINTFRGVAGGRSREGPAPPLVMFVGKTSVSISNVWI